MPKKIIAYECKFNCGKFLKTHSGMSKHEGRCWYDPIKKACISCGNNVDDEEGGRYCISFDVDLFDHTGNGNHKLKHNCFNWIPNNDK